MKLIDSALPQAVIQKLSVLWERCTCSQLVREDEEQMYASVQVGGIRITSIATTQFYIKHSKWSAKFFPWVFYIKLQIPGVLVSDIVAGTDNGRPPAPGEGWGWFTVIRCVNRELNCVIPCAAWQFSGQLHIHVSYKILLVTEIWWQWWVNCNKRSVTAKTH